ncbi:hypothetical protein MnTg02_00085 [bacterium MnTg02]|nr:hypothetical protein MnTg02_00085 [bacterium MnTg02]
MVATTAHGTERTNGLTAGVFRYPALSRHNDVDVRFLQVFVCSGTVNGLVGQQAERTVVDPERKSPRSPSVAVQRLSTSVQPMLEAAPHIP